MDDIVSLGDESGQRRAYTCQRGGVEAELEHGFLYAVAPGFQCFGDAEPSLIVGDVVGDDVDHRRATPLHW